MRKNVKPIILALFLLLFLTSCSQTQVKEQLPVNTPNSEPTGILKPVASFQTINLDLSELTDYIWVDDSLVYREWSYDRLNAERQNSYWRVSLNGETSPALIVKEGNGLEVFCMCADRYHYLYLFGRERRGENSQFFLKKQTLSGEEIYNAEITAEVPDDSFLYSLYSDGEGNLALYNSTYEMVFLFDNNGNYKGKGKIPFLPSGLADGGADGVWLWENEWGTDITAVKIDFEKGSVFEERNICLPSESLEDSRCQQTLLSGCELGLLISTENTLWQYHPITGEANELFSWKDTQLNINGLNVIELRVGEEKEKGFYNMRLFLTGSNGQDTETAEITYVDEAYLPKKQKVILGTTYTTSALSGSVRRFNRKSSQYYVEIREYEQSENPLEKILFDSEGIPDVIEVSDLQREILESKGLLEELESYLKQSDSICEEDILNAVWTTDHANGKLTAMTTRFYISTLGMSTTGIDNSGLSVDRFLQIAEEEQSDFLQYNYYHNMLRCVLEANLDYFVDWSTGKCNFNNEFTTLLKRMNRISYAKPQQGRFYNTLEEELEDFLKGNSQVKFEYITSLKDYQNKCTQYRNNAVFSGYPTLDGRCCHILDAVEQYSIYSGSSCKEGAWEFISFLLSEQEQKHYTYEENGFPVRKDAMLFYIEQPIGKSVQNGIPAYSYLSEENKAGFMEMMETLEAPQYTVTALRSIILEELAPFFAGDKSADEAVKVLQNRVQLYLDENL